MKTTHLTIALFAALALTTAATPAAAFTDAEASQAFDAADQNGDKTLNKTEFRVFIKAIADLGHSEAKRAVKYGSVGYGVAWRQADLDKSGSVTLDELATLR